MAWGEMTMSAFTQLVSNSIATVKPSLAPGGLFYLFMDWRELTGEQAAHVATGVTFRALTAMRAADEEAEDAA